MPSTVDGLHLHATWQFSLEVIMHHKLLFSPYRTLNASEADVFYVPYYSSLACLCHKMAPPNQNSITNNVLKLSTFLKQSAHFHAKKPHLVTISMIEREQYLKTCPLLAIQDMSNFRVIGIEEEPRSALRNRMSKYTKPLIVAPYPAYGHLDGQAASHDSYINQLLASNRTVFLFLAAGTRRSNPFRASIFDNILSNPSCHKTDLSYGEFTKNINRQNKTLQAKQLPDSVWLTTRECQGRHHLFTHDWMTRSVFCLQPPGDSPTRKSFYDAIIAGCIPAIFKEKYQVKYPFQSNIDYSQFTVSIEEDFIVKNKTSILTMLKNIPQSKIKQMQISMSKVQQYLQYSLPIVNGASHHDAIQYILQQVELLLKTQEKW